MTGLLSWFTEVYEADIDAMLRDPLRALIVREDATDDDAMLTIRNGDDDVPWRKGEPFMVVVPGDDVPF